MKFSRKFVCKDLEYSTYEKSVQSPIFRKSFTLENSVDTAEITICGLGFYDLFINGKKITKGYCAPYISNTDHYTYYDNYNIKQYLSTGENVIGVMLGDGFLNGKTSVWDFKDNVMNSAPMLAVNVDINAGDENISFDAMDFVCKKGPVIFNDLRSGVFYDARLEEDGWNNVGFKENGWHKPLLAPKPRGRAKICEAEPIKVYKTITPVSIKKGSLEPYVHSGQIDEFVSTIKPFETNAPCDGGYIYDFGENNSGIFRLKIKGERGQKVSVQCAEQLLDGKVCYSNISFYPDGFSQRDIYYLKGGCEEIFEPMFTFHGFRYLYVTGITEEQATDELLTFLVMSSELEEIGSFECSDAMANTIYEMGRRSDRSNFFYFPMDCPHREKNGWTGDAAASAEHMIMTLRAENSYREWLNNIRAAQRENGEIPCIVPTDTWGYDWGNGPAWDCVLFTLPYMSYKYRGDIEIIKENVSAMMRYLEYISRQRRGDGTVMLGLGDWAPVENLVVGDRPDMVADKKLGKADVGFVDSVMVYDMCKKASAMFDAVGLPLNKSFADTLAEEMISAIRSAYLNTDECLVKDSSQASQAMAVFYGIFNDDEKKIAVENLVEMLRENDNKFTCGFLGMRVLFHVLSDFGYEELAYEMITRKEFPSYGYWAEKGMTTFLENFAMFDEYYDGSANHHFFGDVVNWFMRCAGGLNVISSDTVEVSPKFIDKLDWCRTSYKLPKGEIKIHWERRDGGVELKVKCDPEINYIVKNISGSCIQKDAETYFIVKNF